ncbi:MAG TPA: DUF2807 domain-containing protein [Candidatus Babeliales bacterium]|nr:DUF2807 domain-containing protein [Candidatus Babeliales bacterium]
MQMIFLAFGLACTNLNAMELKDRIIAGSGNESIQRHVFEKVDTFILDGKQCCRSKAGSNCIRLHIAHITDDQQEHCTITTDDNIFSHFIFNARENIASLSLYAPDQRIQPSQEIHVSLALKKYATIAMHGYIETSFAQSIQSDVLKIKATSGAIVHMSGVDAHKIVMEATDDSAIKMLENEQLKTDVIALVCKDDASITAHIQAKVLQVEKDGTGTIKLSGSVDEQKLYLKNGSYLAHNLVSPIIRPIIRKGYGTIEMTGLEWIEGCINGETAHNVVYKTYEHILWMAPEEDILNDFLNKYPKTKEFSKEDILKYIIWKQDQKS